MMVGELRPVAIDRAGDGLRIAWSDGATTTVSTRNGKERVVRGMTEQHKTFEAAKARLDALANDAEKQGWVRGKFQASAKPDAFSTMPAAPKPVAVHGA